MKVGRPSGDQLEVTCGGDGFVDRDSPVHEGRKVKVDQGPGTSTVRFSIGGRTWSSSI